MKRLVFCFDGTWNKLDAKCPTNVVITGESISPSVRVKNHTVAQIIYYDEGVGTSKFNRMTGGLFGRGLLKNLDDAYRFLIFNYAPGDEIYIFGFSRGAYTARSFIGLIRNCGILERKYASKVTEAINHYTSRKKDDSHNSEKMHEFRNNYAQNVCVSEEEQEWKRCNVPSFNSNDFPFLTIKYVGVWDTVGSLGIPSSFGWLASLVNKKYKFHDTRLSRFVESARHAVAIDEKRNTFSPTLWSNFKELNNKKLTAEDDPNSAYQQKWFPGVHGAVGGGGTHRGLSDDALKWVLDGAIHQGLRIDNHSSSRIYDLRPDYRDYLENNEPPKITQFFSWLMYWAMKLFFPNSSRNPGPNSLFEVSESTIRRWQADAGSLKDKELYRPQTLKEISSDLNQIQLMKPMSLPQGTFDIYTVKQGDDLYRISKRFYGDEHKAEILYRVNCDQIYNKEVIYVGMDLKIPTQELIESFSEKLSDEKDFKTA